MNRGDHRIGSRVCFPLISSMSEVCIDIQSGSISETILCRTTRQ